MSDDGVVNDLRFFSEADLDTVVGLVMELAAQLHEERAQRIALEVALERSGVLDPGATRTTDPEVRERASAALDDAMAGLMRLMAESGPPQHPIRNEARDDAWAVQHG
ncbi:hypothetical protein [Egicoccus sp. AB-alg2]|uniref:hypothetical protein n=1 Tax=Egicoccus sp. AB-alg2 TaxID=3242693 RepID=UPI00359CCB9A